MDNTEKESKLTVIDRMLMANKDIEIVDIWTADRFKGGECVSMKGRLFERRDLGEKLESWPASGFVHKVSYFVASKRGTYNPKNLNAILSELSTDKVQPTIYSAFSTAWDNKFMRIGYISFDERVAEGGEEKKKYIKFNDDIFSNYNEGEIVEKTEEPILYSRSINILLFPDATVAEDILKKRVGSLNNSDEVFFGLGFEGVTIEIKDLDEYITNIRKLKRDYWFGRKKVKTIKDLLAIE